MAKRNRLTNNSDETDIASLISGDTIFSIPYFQRPYKWKQERLKQLNQDILNLVDETTDFHFLGAVIVHGRRSNPADPDVFEVIDGQQRITTIFLYLCAVVRTLCLEKEYQEAASLFQKYLVINRETGSISNFKLHLCKDDRTQLNNIYLELISDKGLKDRLSGFKLKQLPRSGKEHGTVKNNYTSALRFLKDELTQGGVDRIRSIYSCILNSMSVVQIDVWDPTNGPKIFDSLNSRQEPMTVGDLIRNEIFSKIADEHPDVIERLDAEHWQPFYRKFDRNGKNLFDSYFFPYALIKDQNLKKSEVYSTLRKEWNSSDDPEVIISDLASYQDAFLDVCTGTNEVGNSPQVALSLQRLYRAGSPSSTYPFLMQVSSSAKRDVIDESDAVGALSVVESFLVRRAVCGLEPTGLHAVFKRLWSDCGGKPTIESVKKGIEKHKTVTWPSDEEFRRCIETRPLYGAGITQYILQEYNLSLGGDTPVNIPWIEHVLPEVLDNGWEAIFTAEEHRKKKDLLANLLPLSSDMNMSLGNKAYGIKRAKYAKDSMFKSARQFADTYSTWTPHDLEDRARQISCWAVARWKY